MVSAPLEPFQIATDAQEGNLKTLGRIILMAAESCGMGKGPDFYEFVGSQVAHAIATSMTKVANPDLWKERLEVTVTMLRNMNKKTS